MSKLQYGVQFWSNCPDYLKKKLQVVQNETIRAVFGRQRQENGHYVSTDPLYEEYDWLKVRQLGPVHDQLMFNNIIKHRSPELFWSVIRDAGNRRHEHNTRASQSQALQRNNDNYPVDSKRRYTFLSRAMSDYNTIFGNRITTLETFKSILKENVRRLYPQ